MEKFNNVTPNLRFTYESSEKSLITFIHLIITLSEQVENYLTYSLQIAINTNIMPPHTQNILSAQLFSAKH